MLFFRLKYKKEITNEQTITLSDESTLYIQCEKVFAVQNLNDEFAIITRQDGDTNKFIGNDLKVVDIKNVFGLL